MRHLRIERGAGICGIPEGGGPCGGDNETGFEILMLGVAMYQININISLLCDIITEHGA